MSNPKLAGKIWSFTFFDPENDTAIRRHQFKDSNLGTIIWKQQFEDLGKRGS